MKKTASQLGYLLCGALVEPFCKNLDFVSWATVELSSIKLNEGRNSERRIRPLLIGGNGQFDDNIFCVAKRAAKLLQNRCANYSPNKSRKLEFHRNTRNDRETAV